MIFLVEFGLNFKLFKQIHLFVLVLFFFTEFVGPAKHELTLHQCTGKVIVTPDIKLNDCVRKEKNANFSALVYMETPSGMGCDRETFEASDIYTLCGASDFIDLLPRPGTGREWTKKLKVFTKKWGGKG